jgi:hypothetical protein
LKPPQYRGGAFFKLPAGLLRGIIPLSLALWGDLLPLISQEAGPIPGAVSAADAVPGPARELNGEVVLKSFLYTYPDRVGNVAWTGGDWTIRVGDKTFYWAGGRLLPEELRHNQEAYRPHQFSVYPETIPSPEDYSPEQIEELRFRGSAEARLNREDHHRAFQAALYGGLTRTEIERNLVRIDFLGHRVTIHRDITDALTRIDRIIAGAAEYDGEIAAFITSIRSVEGYNWREIRGTRRMSYHSWGLALDILTERRNSQVIYWLWEQARTPDWMLVPLRQRWMPPDLVVRTFEREGFTWGGKWALYDNMHFEFRPELHELTRLLAGSPGETRIIKSDKAPDLHHIFPVTGESY